MANQRSFHVSFLYALSLDAECHPRPETKKNRFLQLTASNFTYIFFFKTHKVHLVKISGILPNIPIISFRELPQGNQYFNLAWHDETTLLKVARQPLTGAFQDLSALIIQRHMPQSPAEQSSRCLLLAAQENYCYLW